MDSNGAERQLATELGVYSSPGLGRSWPDLSAAILAIYGDRVAKLEWVPASWFSRVKAGMASGDIYRLLPARKPGGTVRDDLPDWISSDARRVDVWTELSEIVRQAVFNYAQGMAEAGRAELEAAYANAAFWDRLYTATKFVADLPTNAVKAAGVGVGRIFAANWLVFIVVGIGAMLWFNKGTIARAAGKKLARG